MTDSSSGAVDDDRREIAEAFGRERDPLAKFESTFAELEVDAFENFVSARLEPQSLDESTIRQYRSVFEDWEDHMDRMGRHPVVPSKEHVKQFIAWLRSSDTGRGANTPDTVRGKIRKLNKAYEYFQEEAAFPHGQDYNPFTSSLKEVDLDEQEQGEKEEWEIPLTELREHLTGITHLRSLAIIAMQLKLGLRAGEVVNLRLEDFSLEKTEVREHFSEMGSHPRLDGRPNAIYVAPRFERDGNKSRRPRVLPLDEEMQRVMLRYLLVRPDEGKPWLFLSHSHSQLTPKRVNEVWVNEFRPKYGETEQYKPVRSHYGRHRFTTYWRIKQDLNRELVQYMRGDRVGGGRVSGGSAMDEYLHTYYPDIEDVYRERMFRLGL